VTEFAEYRVHTRRELTSETIFLISSSKDRVYGVGTITDISDDGIGMLSSFPYKIGEKLVFQGVEGFFGSKSAYVRWAKQNDVDSVKMGLVFE
jgi:hypothetical protein